jgi:hypothetical protein
MAGELHYYIHILSHLHKQPTSLASTLAKLTPQSQPPHGPNHIPDTTR